MTMTYVFSSADAGAPVLPGQSGSAITWLDAVLVNGYGSVSISSMSRSGSVVTVVTTAPHGFSHGPAGGSVAPATVQIGGAAEADYNGKWRVASVPNSTTFTFNIGVLTPATPATGTMTVKRAPVGWTKAFAGTNKAAYRMPLGSNQHYLRVDDNAYDSQKSSHVRGYRTMSDVDTGTEPFPQIAQTANYYLKKSFATDTVARAWYVIADDYYIHVFVAFTGVAAFEYVMCFGQGIQFNGGDNWMTVLGAAGAGASGSLGFQYWGGHQKAVGLGSTPNGPYYAGDIVGTSGSTPFAGWDGSFISGFNTSANSNKTLPDSVLGDQVITPRYFVQGATSSAREIRGKCPGLWDGLYNLPTFTYGLIKDDFQEFPGRKFMLMPAAVGSVNVVTPIYFDVSDVSWR